MTGTRPRRYMVRGEPVQVQEVTGLYAVSTRAGGELEARVDPQPPAGLQALDAQGVADSFPELRTASVEAFQSAGWTFVRSEAPPRLDAPVAKVFVQAGGRPVLGTGRLTLGTGGSVPEARVAELLAPHGGRILERIEFAPGLYRVEVDPPDGRDVLDVAGALEGLDGIEFAEPEFVEVIVGRA